MLMDPTRPDTVAQLVLQRSGDPRQGLLFEDETWTWGAVVEEALVRASFLASQREAAAPFHVGVLLDNRPEYLFLLAGAALSGAVIVGINPTRRGAELARDIRHTDCQLIITDDEQGAALEGLDIGVSHDRVLVCDSASYRSQIAGHRGASVPGALPSADDLLLLIFTSGSTGAPKAVRMSHGRAAGIAGRVPFSPADVLYSAMPLFHGNALNAAVFPAFVSGATLVLRRRFSASAFLPDVRRYGCTFFNTVGRAIAHINATPPTDHDKDHSLKWVLGPETSESDKAAFTERFGVPVFEGYGSSENAIILNPARDPRPGSLGTAPRGSDIAVIDPASGRECEVAQFDEGGRLLNPDRAIGELVGRNASSRFEGYYNNPEAEAERVRNGWYWSGDLAYRDEAGVFYFAGRSGDWLRVDSENFAAAPVERILARAPGVTGVAVYPVPDARTGDQVMAALELAPGSAFDPAAFADFVATQPDLGPKWVPRYVRIVGAMPVTGTDKVDKKPLRTQRWRTRDDVWHRPTRADAYRLLTDDDVSALEAEFAAHGRTNLLEVP
jgi:fatty-acyl-CoA synthase